MKDKSKEKFSLNENHEKRNAEILKKEINSKVSVEEAMQQYEKIKAGSNR